MNISCPNCNQPIEQHRPPAKNDPSAGDAWVCFRCTTVVCTGCYMDHQSKAHPELYSLKSQPTSGGKKNKKGKKR